MHSEENVEITVYDKVGSKIRTLIKGKIPTGFQNVSWDGTNDKGEKVGSGVYFYKMKTTSGFTDNKKMTLLK
jgi:flagellar hook assembly protein FlgD